jgi:hypothetical protein
LQQCIQPTVKAQLGPQEKILESVLFSEMSDFRKKTNPGYFQQHQHR